MVTQLGSIPVHTVRVRTCQNQGNITGKPRHDRPHSVRWVCKQENKNLIRMTAAEQFFPKTIRNERKFQG